MITEDYVSFETAKLLKEKGFDESCRAVYEEKVLRINTPHQKLEDGLYGEDYESYEQAADEAIKYFVKTQIKGKNGNTQ